MLQGLEVTVHESPITVNGWQGSGYAILDSEYGVGAYKISGGASGGEVLGAKDIASLGFSYIEFFLSMGEEDPSSSAVMKRLTGVLSNAFQTIGLGFGIITDFLEILEKCPNAGPGLISVMMGAMVAIAAIGFLSFTPQGKLLGLLINTIWSKALETISKVALNEAFRDC